MSFNHCLLYTSTTLITVPSRPQQPKKTNIKNNQNTLKPVTVKVEKVGKAQLYKYSKRTEQGKTPCSARDSFLWHQ